MLDLYELLNQNSAQVIDIFPGSSVGRAVDC